MPARTFDGAYYGTVHLSSTKVTDAALAEVAANSDNCGFLSTPTGPMPCGIGKRKCRVTVTETSMMLAETATQEILQTTMLSNLVRAAYVAKHDLVVFCVLSMDNRCAIQLCHIVKVEDGSTLAAFIMAARPLKKRRGSVVANDSARDITVRLGTYLGFVKVSKSKGSSVVQGAISKNGECRAVLENMRLQQKLPRSGRLLGVSKSNDLGTHVQEYPCALIITPRSFRIVDAITGDTISKFFIKQVTFQAITPYKTKPEIFSVITENPNQAPTCHLFQVDKGAGKILSKAFQGLVKQADIQFKKDAGVGKAEKNVFSALDGYERERAPDEFFNKQIRRKFLVPVKVLGAGEFGEVWLAEQTNVLASRKSTRMISKKRAVKMLKADASVDAKEEYLRECRMLLKCGGDGKTSGGRMRSESVTSHATGGADAGATHLVRLVGVALQQAPWLCVLEYVPYGDLRNVLKTAKEKHIAIRTDETLQWCRQLSSGCEHIAKSRIIHMDLAARNVLLGEGNMVKIADFGMSELMDPGKNTKTFVDPIRCAIKWTAMEAMMENRFSEASDVWSIGIVFWEILMRGAMPYPGVNNVDMLYYLIGGDRIQQPSNCPEPLWDVMLKCWEEKPEDRWTFHQLNKTIAGLQVQYTGGENRDLGIYIHTSKGEKEVKTSPNDRKKEKSIGPDGKSLYVYDEAWKPKQQAIESANAAVGAAPVADEYDVALGAGAAAPVVVAAAAAAPPEVDAYDVAIAPAAVAVPAPAAPVAESVPRSAPVDMAAADAAYEEDPYDVALTPAVAPRTNSVGSAAAEDERSAYEAPVPQGVPPKARRSSVESTDGDNAGAAADGAAAVSEKPQDAAGKAVPTEGDGAEDGDKRSRRGSLYGFASDDDTSEPGSASASRRASGTSFGFDGSDLKEEEEVELSRNSVYGWAEAPPDGDAEAAAAAEGTEEVGGAAAQTEPSSAEILSGVPPDRKAAEAQFLRSLSCSGGHMLDGGDLEDSDDDEC
mmetsp:Transcript_1227/g.4116  ORF Transcript_1227/g.4116 Transcript_1227/m.4116 type:complete len:998 (-) Transcript_1227:83-3076(-)